MKQSRCVAANHIGLWKYRVSFPDAEESRRPKFKSWRDYEVHGAGIAKHGKDDGLKTHSCRGPRVQISLPALCSVRVARPILSAFRQLPDSRYWKKAEDARSNRARSI